MEQHGLDSFVAALGGEFGDSPAPRQTEKGDTDDGFSLKERRCEVVDR